MEIRSSLPLLLLLLFSFVLLAGCRAAPDGTAADGGITWSIAIHGGAGTIDRGASPEVLQQYEFALTRVLTYGRDRLAQGAHALDVCEEVVRALEDEPLFNAGKGAVFDEDGKHALDASIMDGTTLRCGAVAGLRTVQNPISLARLVMERTPHVLLAGDGAEQFATAMGVPRVPNEYFDTESRRRVLEEVLRERARTGALLPSDRRQAFGTVGCVVRDRDGRLAAATSTGGLTGKRWGRVGDTPVVGAGTYANQLAAVSCTGTGEEFIRHGVARTVAARMQYGGQSLAEAAHAVVFETLAKDDGGLIAVDAAGNLVAPFNSNGMYRGLADSRGRFAVRIFED